MKICLNGEKKDIPVGATIDQLLESFRLKRQSIICELNHQVVDRTVYSKTQLKENDSLEIVHFVGGG